MGLLLLLDVSFNAALRRGLLGGWDEKRKKWEGIGARV